MRRGRPGYDGTMPADPASSAVIALVPAYDEGPRVGDVVGAAAAHLPVPVVDDGSSDDTAEAAEAAGATVLRQRPNQGKGAAIRAGFRWAIEQGLEAVVILDADGQHDPAELPRFLRAFAERRADLIIGRRDFRQMPAIRRLSNTVGGWAFSWRSVAASPTTSPATGSSAAASWNAWWTATRAASSSTWR